MAIAVKDGHTARALEFYNTPGKYFIIGGTIPWEDESSPDTPQVGEFKLNDVVGLKKVDNVHLVVPDDNGTIVYRTQRWRVVPADISTTVGTTGVTEGSVVVPVTSVAGLTVGSKVRIANLYEATITSISNNLLTLSAESPAPIPAGATVLGGAIPEGAHYVYLDCYLNYDEFPLVTYRQIGLCTAVTPNTADILLSAAYSSHNADEFASLGRLEVLDNRVPSTRDISMREQLSLIIEL